MPDRDDKYYTLLRNIRIILQDVEFTIIEDTEDNIYNVIWHRLNNKSIDITFKGSNITSLKQQQQLFIYFRMENVTIEEGNLDEIKRVLYLNANESIVYIHEITPTEIEHIYNITGFAKQDQFNTYSKHMATFSIATDVIGATNIHTSNGQALMITLKKERKKLCVTKINITKVKFNIEKVYENEIEKTKAMIYKAYNVNNYYISYIIEVDETNNHDITIQMYSNQMNTITQTLTEADIEIKKN